MGKVINPMGVSGQLEGGISMGPGYALSEEMKLSGNGRCMSSNFKSYHIFNSAEMPNIKTAFVDSKEETGPFGAKSVGECAVVPVAPAVLNAISNAVGSQILRLPARPEDVKRAIERSKVKN